MGSLKKFMVVENGSPKILPLTGKSGTVYIADSGITMGRYTQFEKYQLAASLGLLPKQLFDSMKKTHEYFNNGKFGDGLLNNANNMTAVARIADGENNPFFYLCTMFINAKDEDLTTWDESKAKLKLEDWSEYDVNDFFLFASTIAPTCTDDLSEIFRASMENQKKKELSLLDDNKKK